MKKMFFMLLAVAALCTAPFAAQAEDTDVAKVKCSELLKGSEESVGMLVLWIDGYMGGMSDNTMMNAQWVDQLGTHIGKFCAANPNKTLMEASEAMPETEVSGGQDMLKITCKDFLADQSGVGPMLMWIDGYLSAKSENTVLNEEWMKKLGTHLGTYCAKNGGKTVGDALDNLPQ
jgi:acid stress chaperone HdeB